MSNQLQKKVSNPIKGFFEQDAVQAKFADLLGKRSSVFLTSVLQLVNSNDLLAKADPKSIYAGAIMAATLDLPLNNNLGFAYLIPYGNQAQFQLGYRAYIQLAQRSGQFQTISAAPIYDGQIIKEDPLTGFEFDFSKKESSKVVGYAAFFRLINGFEKTFYMTYEELEEHGKKYSKTFNHKNGLWKTDFNAMATKTVLKLLLSKYAPLSVEMQTAVTVDQGVINDPDTQDVDYVDNESGRSIDITEKEPEIDRIKLLIEDGKTVAEMEQLGKGLEAELKANTELSNLYDQRFNLLMDAEVAAEETKGGQS